MILSFPCLEVILTNSTVNHTILYSTVLLLALLQLSQLIIPMVSCPQSTKVKSITSWSFLVFSLVHSYVVEVPRSPKNRTGSIILIIKRTQQNFNSLISSSPLLCSIILKLPNVNFSGNSIVFRFDTDFLKNFLLVLFGRRAYINLIQSLLRIHTTLHDVVI